ncbi:MAG TPA: DUF4190 domain-containing protein [Pyrinomonadaceae bacterium]|nr:DUF4190 domain-containing protein [Pyrinomonadaceae bacterium]
MKRCPTCNQTFDEEWLSFCTQDGTGLIEDSARLSEPPPTVMAPPMPPSVSPNEQPTINLPGSEFTPAPAPRPYNPPQPMQPSWQPPPQPMQSGWQPPPPPAYANKPKQGLAIASLILGLASVTIGLCCYFGTLTAPVAIILGIISLVQIKNNPTENTGKPLSIIGIVSGALYFVVIAFIILIYGMAFLMQGVNR